MGDTERKLSRKEFSRTIVIIYMFSDGYADQFGGQNEKKFSNKKFRELLLNIHAKSMHEQKSILEKTMENWMKETEQIDDITIMGIRL